MEHEEREPLDRYREVGLKTMLFVFALDLFVLGFLVGLRTWTQGAASLLSDGGVALGSFLIFLAAFLWTTRRYVTTTERGLKLLERFPPHRGKLPKTR